MSIFFISAHFLTHMQFVHSCTCVCETLSTPFATSSLSHSPPHSHIPTFKPTEPPPHIPKTRFKLPTEKKKKKKKIGRVRPCPSYSSMKPTSAPSMTTRSSPLATAFVAKTTDITFHQHPIIIITIIILIEVARPILTARNIASRPPVPRPTPFTTT
mmetsp:Transcript_8229/g.15529  ORF Transcript_8229/g.15529 Transcript_8229/m.15529 type:complete len:157 (-) Transcript_8229:772-1242(-)